MSDFMDMLFGKKGGYKEKSALTEDQGALLQWLIQSLMGGGGPFAFDEESFQRTFVDPALKQFQTKTTPAIQQRFIAKGLQGSSGMDTAIANAGADVEMELGKMRAGMQENALDRALKAAGLSLGTKAFGFEQESGSEGLLTLMAALAGGAYGGLPGAAIGAGVGSAGSSIFRR